MQISAHQKARRQNHTEPPRNPLIRIFAHNMFYVRFAALERNALHLLYYHASCA